MSGRGTSASQDGRYFAQEKKLLATMKFPSCFQQCVDMSKVQRDVINQWITQRLTQLLGFEDEIVVAMAINSLEPKVDEKLDPKHLQLSLTGFLEKHAGTFMEELWQLLLSAQNNPTGIPSSILDKKKQEMECIAMEKDRLKKVLIAKKTEISKRGGDREGKTQEKVTGAKDERQSSPKRGDGRRRSRSLQRRTRSPRRWRRSPSPRRRRRSPSLRRKRGSPSPRRKRRSRSLPRGRSRRGRSRSPSVKRRRSRRGRSPSRSPDRARERRSARSGRSSRRESSRRTRRSLSSSSSESRRRSPSSSRSPTPARRRKDSLDSESGSD